MGKPKPIGQCHLCGENGPLTDEHVPPEAAFNDRKVVMTQMFYDEGGKGRRRQHQRGYKQPVLCVKCNNNTGAWYGDEYARFAVYCAERATPRARGLHVGVDLSSIRPLRVIKQALVMLCASSTPGIAEKTPQIRRLALDRHATGRPGTLRLLCYLVANPGGGRSTGVTGIGNLGGSYHVVAEFAWWPVGWVLAMSPEPLPQLCDLTHWSTLYSYDDRSSITIPIPCLSIASPVPLDYRTQREIDRDRRRNLDEARIIKPR
jgi:hypothetical protein